MQKLFREIVSLLAVFAFLAGSPCVLGQQSRSLIVDHCALQSTAGIPQSWLDRARNLNFYFGHQSVGNNLLSGLAELAQQSPQYYALTIAHGGNPSCFAAQHGIVDFPVGRNGDPVSKIDDFAAHLDWCRGKAVDAAMMKICFVDINPQTNTDFLSNRYCRTMEELERTYPHTRIIWCTCPLVCNQNNSARQAFNDNVRQFCRQRGKVLFDLADIESHDSGGRESGNQFGPALCPEYSLDGGHPSSPAGRQRLAYAWWLLMAHIAGWENR